jgi:WW domain
MAGRGRGVALTVPAWVKRRDSATAVSDTLPVSVDLDAATKTSFSVVAPASVADWASAVASNGRTYWYSRSTGQRTWIDPSPGEPGVGAAPVTARAPETIALVAAGAAASGKPLWAKNMAASGRAYYYNRLTRKTSWEPPPGFADDADAAAVLATRSTTMSTFAQQRAVASGFNAAADVQKIESPQTTATVPTTPAPSGPASPLPPGWVAYKSPEGKDYYHNAATGKTVWQRPILSEMSTAGLALSGRPSVSGVVPAPLSEATQKRETLSIANLPVQQVTSLPLRAEKRRRRTRDTPRGYAARPMDKDGVRYLNDKETEAYFLGRSEKERARLSEVARKARSASGKGERGVVGARKIAGLERQQKERNATEFVHVKKEQREVTDEQREMFEEIMRDSGVTKDSSWLETMARCTPDERYLSGIKQYGHRKLVYSNFVAKLAKASREDAFKRKVSAEDALFALLDELFAAEPASVSKLSECNLNAVRRYEADPRYADAVAAASVGDSSGEVQRSNMVRDFFLDRQRISQKRQVATRRVLKENLRRVFDSVAVDLPSALVVGSDASDTAAPIVDDGKKSWLTERTTLREVEEKLAGTAELDKLERSEVAEVYDAWIRAATLRATERQARERKAARQAIADRRQAFSKGVEQLMLDGRLSFRSQWHDSSVIVLNEPFGKAAMMMPQMGPLEPLFEEGLRQFYVHVDNKTEDFRNALKAAKPSPILLTDEVGVAELRKVESFAPILGGISDSVLSALLHERRKKEARRKEYATEEFEELLRRRDVDASTDWDSLKASIEERTVYKELVAIVGKEGVKAVYDNMIMRRENRRKRRAEASGSSLAREGMKSGANGKSHGDEGNGHVTTLPPFKRSKRDKLAAGSANSGPPITRGAERDDTDSGWAAALTAKPQGPAELRADRERKKREILAKSLAK